MKTIILHIFYVILIILYFLNIIYLSYDKLYYTFILNVIIFLFILLNINEIKKNFNDAKQKDLIVEYINYFPVISGLILILSFVHIIFFSELQQLQTISLITNSINIVFFIVLGVKSIKI